jgi:serine/threonine-protein kinase
MTKVWNMKLIVLNLTQNLDHIKFYRFSHRQVRVKDGRTIVLKVNPKTYAPVTIPDILDGYKGLAFRKLERLELKVGDTIYEPNIQKDAVIRMMYNGAVIKPGAKVPMFSTIDLVIGTGPKRNVTVPNLVGMTVAQAKVVIAQNLFEVGLVDHQDGGKVIMISSIIKILKLALYETKECK